jgi:hypothetical protein
MHWLASHLSQHQVVGLVPRSQRAVFVARGAEREPGSVRRVALLLTGGAPGSG